MMTKQQIQSKPEFCPVCKSTHIIKYGFVYSHHLKTYGQRLAQVYRCENCLTKMTPSYLRKTTFYPKWLKSFVIKQIKNDPTKSCQDIGNLIREKFGCEVSASIVRSWIVDKAKIKLVNRLQKNWKTRRKHFGKSGMSKQWHEKRKVVQEKLWKNSEYRQHMSKVHRHPQHKSEIVDFCLSLVGSGLSLRSIAKLANERFGTKIAHDTISQWCKGWKNEKK
jgi:transposase-like protein